MEGRTAYMQPCLFPKVLHAGYAVQEGKKSMQVNSPKNGSASKCKPKERLKRCRDARAVLQQACEVEL